MGSSNKETVTTALTSDEIMNQLAKFQIPKGSVLEVHCSLKNVGYIIGGAQTLVDCLIKTVGQDGTVVMTHMCSENSEPAYWCNPPIERSLWETVRNSTPAFSSQSTETMGMSVVNANLSRRSGCYNSNHPNCGFIAYGRLAEYITENHSLDFPLGDNSPLGKMYNLPSYILLIGVDYDNCTAMHLGECRSGKRAIIMQGAAVNENGQRKWKKYLDYDVDSDDFTIIGNRMEEEGLVNKGYIGSALCKLMKFTTAVDYAQKCFIEEAI